MSSIKLTLAPTYDEAPPLCPHCGELMDGAALTLGDLCEFWPLPKRLTADEDGYSYDDGRSLVVDCPTCLKPSSLGIDHRNFKLMAARTTTDRAYQETVLA
jgi:hypothetical protein